MTHPSKLERKPTPTLASPVVAKPVVAKPLAPASAKPARRTQAERSATTRKRLIDAAILCLHQYGYAATTTVLVAEKAGISRGAMLHQFATKVDLMLAVVERSYQDQIDHYATWLSRGKSISRNQINDLLGIAWDVAREPSAMAFYEIWLATRSDEDLSDRFAPVYERIKKRSFSEMQKLMKEAGIDADRKTIEAITRLNIAALRGLAIEWTMERDPERLEGCVDLLKDYTDSFTRQRRQEKPLKARSR